MLSLAATEVVSLVSTSGTPASPVYNYDVTVTNTGTTTIGTFWFAWIPGYDLLPHAPTSIASPTGWTGANAPDVFGVASVQWVNTTTPLQPGQTLAGLKFAEAVGYDDRGSTRLVGVLPAGQVAAVVDGLERQPAGARLPAAASSGMIMRNRPQSIAIPSVVFKNGVFAFSPAKALPLFPTALV